MEELRPSRSRADPRSEPFLWWSASESSSTGTQQGKSSRSRLAVRLSYPYFALRTAP